MLGQAIALTLHDLRVGLEIVCLLLIANVLLVGSWCLTVWFFGYRPAKKLREEEQRERFEEIELNGAIRVRDRSRRGPSVESQTDKTRVGLPSGRRPA